MNETDRKKVRNKIEKTYEIVGRKVKRKKENRNVENE